jgi:hypothetical protein
MDARKEALMAKQDDNGGNGPKYELDIDGTQYPWDRDTITREEIIRLAGWAPDTQAVLVDADQNETTLQPNQAVEVKPGLGFGKKVKFKRG